MISLLLIAIVFALFSSVLAFETLRDSTQPRPKATGLVTWLVSGNWPAKVGAGFVIIGIGALLRYAFANIDVPPELKLGSGAILAAAFGFMAMMLRNRPKRRAVYLALSGAAFGVAYLTAYSAYGFFNYINDVNALALLALVAIAAGYFAVTSNAMSVAILAMIGAYIAPKFALGTPGVLPIYGYYLAASILCLAMVIYRGWRPLIHLSFLFTLAGALFFGWSGKFYEPTHYATMQPLLLALTIVHLLMPLMEKKHIRSIGLVRFDIAYFVTLPLVAASLMLKIAPNLHSEGTIGLFALAMIWAFAAVALYALRRDEMAHHAIVAVLLAFASALCFVQDLPWLLVGLGLSVTTIAVSEKLEWPRSILGLAFGAATLFGSLHIIQSITQPTPEHAFLNELFAYRIIASALLLVGARVGMRQSMSFSKILGLIGGGWATLSILAELVRLHLVILPHMAYGVILGMIFVSLLIGNKKAVHPAINGLLFFALIGCGWMAIQDTPDAEIIVYLGSTTAVLLGMAWSGRDSVRKDNSDFSPSMAIGLLPFALLPWAISTAAMAGLGTDFFEASIAMIGIALAGLAARLWLRNSPRWNETIQPLHVYFTVFSLVAVTLLHIERGFWPVTFELLALIYLVAYVKRRSNEQSGVKAGIGIMMVLSTALVVQAMLLRTLGPNALVMNASDISKMHLPAIASLTWVIFGAGLAWWGTHSKSRSVWSAGSLLLAVAAVKLALFDFGTLGQLGNIIAFIAAGLVFLGVAWFAPIPPKPEPISIAVLKSSEKPEIPKEQARPAQDIKPGLSAQTTKVAVEHPATVVERISQTRSPARSQYRQEPKGINGLWFLLLGLGILIAVLSSVWHKHTRLQKERLERQQISEMQRKAGQQASELAEIVRTTVPPTPSSTAASEVTLVVERKSTAVVPFAPALDLRSTVGQSTSCDFSALQLPSEFSVFAAGAYSGRQIAFQIDQSGHEGTQIDVAVNSPNKPVVLMLGAYEPTIWNIGWSERTKILAVLVSGYHRQVVAGLGDQTPLLISTYDNRGACGYFYVTSDNLDSLNPKARSLFGRPVDMVYPAANGKVVVGEPLSAGNRLVTSTDVSPESFRNESVPPAGFAGLEYSVRKGILRIATAADAETWADAVARNSPEQDRPPIAGQGVTKPPRPGLHNAYVVLKPFTYPSGLYGANSATFLIQKGVPKPSGNPGHSVVYDFNTLSCQGVLCSQR